MAAASTAAASEDFTGRGRRRPPLTASVRDHREETQGMITTSQFARVRSIRYRGRLVAAVAITDSPDCAAAMHVRCRIGAADLPVRGRRRGGAVPSGPRRRPARHPRDPRRRRRRRLVWRRDDGPARTRTVRREVCRDAPPRPRAQRHDRAVRRRRELAFPFPLVARGERWRFDTAAGQREITFRRIGANEATAIEVCHAATEAPAQGGTSAAGTDSIATYAERLAAAAPRGRSRTRTSDGGDAVSWLPFRRHGARRSQDRRISQPSTGQRA